MFKRNPYLLIFNFIMYSIAICNFNIYIKLGIFLIMFSIKMLKEDKVSLFSIFILLILIINFLYQKLFIFSNLLMIIYYILLMFNYLSKKDIHSMYSYMFKSKNKRRDLAFIKFISFNKVFKRSLSVNNSVFTKMNYSKNISYYFYLIKLSYKDTKEKLNNEVKLYQDRSFFNNNKNRVIIRIDYIDILVSILYFIIMIISVRWR